MGLTFQQDSPAGHFTSRMFPRRCSRTLWAVGGAITLTLLFLHSQGIGRPRASAYHLLDDINNSTFGFEKVFVVGLPTRTDRRDGMLLQASLSNLDVEFIDGVRGGDVPDSALVSLPGSKRLQDSNVGSWRAHMNAIHEIVKRNLSSALIMEDDVAWDVRIRQQLKDFALSSQALTQPLQGFPGAFADPTFPHPPPDAPGAVPDIPFYNLPATEPARWSPYGDNWDMLWIGHCGMHFPWPDNAQMPKGRVIHANDVTVPQRRNLWTINIPFTLKEKYPEHTRAAHHVQEGVCSLGYAVTQKTARQILNEIALREVSDAFDILLRFFCEGVRGRRYHNCLTLQPALIHHHRPAGANKAMSDIGDHGEEFREKASTDMVRWSVRINADVLLEGGTDFVDGYPDMDD